MMELYVDSTVQFFEGEDTFRNTHIFTNPILTIDEEVFDDDTYLTDILAPQIEAIIEKEYGGAGYEVTGGSFLKRGMYQFV